MYKRQYITSTGNRDLGPLYWDFGADSYAPDQAFDVAVDSVGDIIVVGVSGNDGATGADDANRDWHVRKYAGSASGTFASVSGSWIDARATPRSREDRAAGAAARARRGARPTRRAPRRATDTVAGAGTSVAPCIVVGLFRGESARGGVVRARRITEDSFPGPRRATRAHLAKWMDRLRSFDVSGSVVSG